MSVGPRRSSTRATELSGTTSPFFPTILTCSRSGPIAPLIAPIADQDGELALVVEPVELVRQATLQRVVGLISHVADREPDLLRAGAIHHDVELGQALRPGGGDLVEAGDLLGQPPRLFAHRRASFSRSGPKKITWIGAALEAITSAPISLIVRRRIPGMVPHGVVPHPVDHLPDVALPLRGIDAA